jgi:hypothetical protein
MAGKLAPWGQFRPRSIWLSMMMLGAFGLIAGASVAPAYGQAAQSGSVNISIDTPTEGQAVKVGETISFGGWAVVTDAASGVESVEVYIDGQPGEGGVRLGKASYGSARPDVAASLGNSAFTNVGFELPWQVSGTPGNRMVYVYAYSAAHGWSYQALTLTVEPRAASSGASSSSSSSSTSQSSQSRSAFAPTGGMGYLGQGSQFGLGGNPALGQAYGAGTGAYSQGMGNYGLGAQFASGSYAQGYGAGTGNPQWGGPLYAASLQTLARMGGSPYSTSSQYGYGSRSAFAPTGYGGTSPFAPIGYAGASAFTPAGYGARSPYGLGYPMYQGYAGW